MGATERGGVLLRYASAAGGAALAFVPAETALRLAALTSLTEVPGAKPPVVGIALADGAIVTVLDLGRALPPRASLLPPPPSSTRPSIDDWPVPGANRAVLCTLGGLLVALTGGTVITTGLFQADPGDEGIFWRGELVPVLDVRALYAQAEAAIWADRATGRPGPSSGRAASFAPSSAPPRDDTGGGAT